MKSGLDAMTLFLLHDLLSTCMVGKKIKGNPRDGLFRRPCDLLLELNVNSN